MNPRRLARGLCHPLDSALQQSKENKSELPEVVTADDRNDIGFVARGWVWHSCNYTGAANRSASGGLSRSLYDLTNLATVKDWPLLITIVDLIWGTILSIAVSCVGFLAGKWLG